jgi:hypothetical protein
VKAQEAGAAVVTSNKVLSPEQPAARQAAKMSPARCRLLCSMLTNYAHLLVALAVASTVVTKWQQPVWIIAGEIGLAIVFLGLAFFLVPER